jgi:hypothetical protein
MPPVIRQYRSSASPRGSLGPGANARAVAGFRQPDQIDVLSGAAQQVQQAIGQAVDIGIRQVAIERQQQVKSAAAYAGKALAESRLYWLDEFEKAKAAAKPDAAGFTDDVKERFNVFREKILSEAPDEDARGFIEEKLPFLQADVTEDAIRYQATTRVTYRRGQVVAGIETAQNAAFLQPDRRSQILDEQVSMIDAAGLDAAEAESLKKSARQSLADAAYRARAMKDPRGTLAALTDPNMRADGAADLDFGSRMQIAGAAEAEIKRQEAEALRAQAEARSNALADVRGRIEDEMALRAAGRPVENPITRADVARAFKTREEADKAWAEISVQQRYASAAGQIKGLPVDEQERILASATPGTQQEGFADRQKLYEMLEREVAGSRAEGAQVIQERLRNEIDLRQRGEPVADPLSRDDLVSAIGQKGADAWAELQGTISRASAVGLVKGSGPAAQEALLDYTAPDPSAPDYAQQLEQQDTIRKAIQDDRKAREADPGGYAVATSPSALAAFEENDIQAGIRASLAKQEELQIPEEMRRPLPKAVAQQLVGQITAQQDPALMVDALAANTVAIRDPVARRKIVEQLIEAGLPAGTSYAVDALDRGEREASIRIMTALSAPKPDLDTTTKKDVEEAIGEALTERNDVLSAISIITGDQRAVGMASTDRDLIMRLAGISALASGDPYSAVERAATDAFGGDQPVLFDSGELAAGLAPPGVDLEALETKLGELKANPGAFLSRDRIKQAIGGALPPQAAPERAPPEGLLTPGNIDLNARPTVKNPDGSISTVLSMSFEQDGQEVLVPMVSDDGKILSEEQAIQQYERTGKFLGKFATPDAATAYAERLHEDQAVQYGENPLIDRFADTLLEDAAETGRFVVDANGVNFMIPAPRDDGSTSYVRAKTFSFDELR